jgi:hypothetical protein
MLQEENISNPFQKDTVEEKRRRIKQISKKRKEKISEDVS